MFFKVNVTFVFIHASYNYKHNYCIHVEITYKCVCRGGSGAGSLGGAQQLTGGG